MRLVVTGANGLVGSRLCAQATAAGHTVVGLGRGPKRTEGPHAYVSCDLTRAAEVEQAIAAAKPDVVLHPASMTNVDGCEKDPSGAWAGNVDATVHVAKATQAAGAHLVHVSTDYVFDGDAGPYAEDALVNPRGVYALTKAVAEQAARTFAPGCAIARTAIVYGWPAAANLNFGAWLVTTLSAGQQVKLFEDQVVSPSLADNVAAMLLELGERRLGGVWHTAGAEVIDRVSFGRRLAGVFGFDERLIIPTRMAELKLPSPRPLRSGLITGKVQAQLSARPLTIDEQLQSFHAHWQGRR
ncbi:MAG: SDR family oxidoreductase [Myxococcaceae bacterium]|nr:SDR family oxidoreductase [Myxococcaceae bacterium]MCI0672113.1 SDR family oxidoreductase [Myxococcaceae bacterium]